MVKRELEMIYSGYKTAGWDLRAGDNIENYNSTSYT